jgi:hypothetical protein
MTGVQRVTTRLAHVRRRIGRFALQIGPCAFLDNLAVVQFDIAIGETEVTIVVGNHQHRFALRLQIGQQTPVEHLLEGRILVGGDGVLAPSHHRRANGSRPPDRLHGAAK